MLLHGIDERELARRAGLALGTVRNLLSECGPFPQAKHAIEQLLQVPIWTRPSEFRRRRSSISKPTRS